MALTRRFDEAVLLALALHRKQTRKGTGVPYASHLLAVASLVLEHGGDEDEAIAALLHDAAEDQGGEATLATIRERFGDDVAALVAACTDAFEQPRPPWRQRKERYLAHLRTAPEAVRRVSAADKLHNARCIVRDARHDPAVWGRFSGGRDGVLWYYRSLAAVFEELGPATLAAELSGAVAAMEAAAASPRQSRSERSPAGW